VRLHEALAAARARLESADIPSRDAAFEAELFARTILGWDRAQLITAASSPAPPALEPRLSEWVERRARREPVAYIVGTREFWGLNFLVTPAVLIPRPETEFIVEEALHLFGRGSDGSHRAAVLSAVDARIADIGTGSGCIAVALAHELPGSRVVATDVSDDAVRVAMENATRHGVASRIQFVVGSYLTGVDGQFDLIVSNPPYVRELDRPALAADVRHEPEVALFGGPVGLRDIEGVLDTAAERLRPRGWLVMEFGYGQRDDVDALVAKRPALRVDRVRDDFQGIERTAIIERR
jgi:release factor glutamine methyltransferase